MIAPVFYHHLAKNENTSLTIYIGDKESAWKDAGLKPGLQIWRIEKFTVVSWPSDRTGSFYDGDSYIILHVSA